MRNLILRSFGRSALNKPDTEGYALCVNDFYKCFYVLGDEYLSCYQFTGELKTNYKLRDCVPEDTTARAVGIQYNSSNNEICIALKNGNIICFNCHTQTFECVGFVEQGLKAMQWSPDLEALVLITGTDTIIVMTGTYDPVAEVEFHQESFGEKQFVTVGWGKKETQFHGAGRKNEAKFTAENDQCSSTVSDDKPRISWRGDCQLFAVSMLCNNGDVSYRQIRIFNRDSVLQYTCENLDGLQSFLTWRPSGNLIASIQIVRENINVIFIEKNGLKHGEFTLPFKSNEVTVQELSWNSQSNILAIWCVHKQESRHIICLWTTANYHWYLKQNLKFPAGTRIKSIQWDPDFDGKLYVWYDSDFQELLSFEWIFMVNHSSYSLQRDSTVVGVIDGDALLVTSFREKVIPPPMCEQKLTVSASIAGVAFGPTLSPNSFICYMNDGTLALFKLDLGSREYSLVLHSPLEWPTKMNDSLSLFIHHWIWTEENLLVACMTNEKGMSSLLQIEISEGKFLVRYIIDMPNGIVTNIADLKNSETVIVQLNDGKLYTYNFKKNSIEKYMIDFLEPCTRVMPCTIGSSSEVLGYSTRNKVYLGDKQIIDKVTSVFVLPHFLIVTTASHSLLLIRLSSPQLFNLDLSNEGRRIERGARIVVANEERVVLQMPRGNLETIIPRPLLLYTSSRLLNSGNYRDAYELFRKQRINLNLFVDHNPKQFLKDITHFIKDIRNPSWITLFLSELSEEDCTKTMYAEFYNDRSEFKSLENKINTVCDLVRESLKNVETSSQFIKPILTSFIKKGAVEDMENAFKYLKETCKDAAAFDDGLKHMLYIIDVNELYNIALGTYDFDLVIQVAQKSTKDPKEYLPFLNNLKKMEPEYRMFSVDKYLKRNLSALKHIALCPDKFDECLTFVKTNKLYSKALMLFNRDSKQYKEIALAYGEYLFSQHLYEESTLMFERSSNMKKALEGSLCSLDWHRALFIMGQMDCQPKEIHENCRSLAANLIAKRKFNEAALLLYEHVGDAEESIAALVLGNNWSEALRLVQLSKRRDLIETHIKPGILEHFEDLKSQISNLQEQFTSYRNRLSVVRAAKQQELLEIAENDPDLGGECDLYSDTSSVMASSIRSSRYGSSSSGRSSQSSKNRRKQERKILSLKEGSKFEDLALLRALHQSVTTAFSLQDEVHKLCLSLLNFHFDIQAVTLQNLLSNLLVEVEAHKAEIWPPSLIGAGELGTASDSTYDNIALRIQNREQESRILMLEPQYRFPPQMPTNSKWKLSILTV